MFLSWAFPEGGWAPFPTSAYVPIPLFTLACLAVLPRREATLRWGVLLYGLGATLALAIETPMGGNAVRLGALFEAPSCCAPSEGQPWVRRVTGVSHARCPARTARLLAVVARRARRDRVPRGSAARSDYFDPLHRPLPPPPRPAEDRDPVHSLAWEGSEMEMDQALARGWLRQLDTGLHPIFYREGINRITYASWLSDNAVRYVALPSASGRSSYGERALIENGLPYLRLRWKSDDWRVYEVLLLPARDLAEGRRHRARAVPVGQAAARREAPRRGHRESALDALLVRLERVRGAARRLDEGGRRRGGLRAPLDALRARAAVPARPPLRRLNLPGERPGRARLIGLAALRTHPIYRQLVRVWRLSSRWLPNGWIDAIRQLGLFAGAYYLYRIVRGLVDGQTGLAFENARTLVDAERSLGLFFEPGLQAWAKSQEWLLLFANWMYVNSHFVVTTTFLIWLYLARNYAFYFVRNMFMVAMGLALVGYLVYPTAPPRFPARVGFTDTVAAGFVGETAENSANVLYNPFAAVPSMHVAFALMISVPAFVLVRVTACSRRSGRSVRDRDPGRDGHRQPLLARRRRGRARGRCLGRHAARAAFAACPPDAWGWRTAGAKAHA